MLFNFPELVKRHNMQFTGVIHIGAHDCGETIEYAKAGIKNGILIEANPYRAERLSRVVKAGKYMPSSYPFVLEKLPDEYAEIVKHYKVLNHAMWHTDGEKLKFNMADMDGGVDSLYPINQWGKDSSWYPYTHRASVELESKTLDTVMKDFPEEYNFINIDVEGAELDVFKGGVQTLSDRIKYVLCETQDKSRFDGSCLQKDVEEFLAGLGFKYVDYYDTGKLWGDGLYAKS